MSFNLGFNEISPQLTATRLAKWLIQNEYYHIELGDQCLVLENRQRQEVIPFDDWDGTINVVRGTCWGTLELQSADQQTTWRVQGLPWQGCKPLAQYLIDHYRHWAGEKVAHLDEAIPDIVAHIEQFTEGNHCLRRSKQQVLSMYIEDRLTETQLSSDLALAFRPKALEWVSPWIKNTEKGLTAINQQRMQSALIEWSARFDDFESKNLGREQREAVLLNQDHNLVLASAGTGKTSILVARACYLIESEQVIPEHVLIVSRQDDHALAIEKRLIAQKHSGVQSSTFHDLGIHIIETVTEEPAKISPLSVPGEARDKWLSSVLVAQWKNNESATLWQRHLTHWRIPGMRSDMSMLQLSRHEPLTDWIWQVMALISQRNLDHDGLLLDIERRAPETQKLRIKSELALIWPCYQAYCEHLSEHNQMDFNTMLMKAAELVDSGEFFIPWKTVMIDDYQDIEQCELMLLSALCTGTPLDKKPTLFAVGDEWLSVDGVKGNNHDITKRFIERFSDITSSPLTTAYRFHDKITKVSSEFMERQSTLPSRQIKGCGSAEEDGVTLLAQPLMEAELSLLAGKNTPLSVLFIGRQAEQIPEKLAQWQKRWPHLSLEFVTCVESRGLETDYVFILDVNQRVFPAEDREKGLLNCLQARDERTIETQERRLFYTALTRAKKHVWVCADTVNASSFINELLDKEADVVINKIKRVKPKHR